VFAKLDSRTVEKQNEWISATATKYSSELKFVYGRRRVKVTVRVGRPYAQHQCVYAYGRPAVCIEFCYVCTQPAVYIALVKIFNPTPTSC